MIPAPAHEPQRSRYSWRGALVACCLNMVGMPMDLLLAARDIPNMPAWAPLMSSATGAALVIILLARRRNPTGRLAAIVFLVNTGVLVVALLAANPAALPAATMRSTLRRTSSAASSDRRSVFCSANR